MFGELFRRRADEHPERIGCPVAAAAMARPEDPALAAAATAAFQSWEGTIAEALVKEGVKPKQAATVCRRSSSRRSRGRCCALAPPAVTPRSTMRSTASARRSTRCSTPPPSGARPPDPRPLLPCPGRQSACASRPSKPEESALYTLTERPLTDRDGPRDECGVFGVFAPGHDVSRLAYFSLYALQHRGQERPGSPPARAATSPPCATSAWSPRSSTRRSCGRWRATWRSATSATRPPAAALGERATGLARRRPRAGACPQRQPDQRGRALGRAEGARDRFPRHLGFRDHGGAALLQQRQVHRGRGQRRDAAPAGRLLDRGDDQARDRRLPRSATGLRSLSLGRVDDRFVVASESCAVSTSSAPS